MHKKKINFAKKYNIKCLALVCACNIVCGGCSYELTGVAPEADTESVIEKESEIEQTDFEAPSLRLEGESKLFVLNGESYEEPGFSAWDETDGDLTQRVMVLTDMDTNTNGVYTISYCVLDEAGNESVVEREVHVYTPVTDHAIYLTFDDGPGPYTMELLDLLDEYNIKATFFVTDTRPEYRYLIAEEAKRGHTIAVHTASHNYRKIYASAEAFWEDVDAMNAVIYEQTGAYANILRFPGGSSNSVCNRTLMKEIIESMPEHGFRYCDWNVSTADGGDGFTTEIVLERAKRGIFKNEVSVILQHDVKKASMAAVEDIINFGLDNGYSFYAMDETSEMVHHR